MPQHRNIRPGPEFSRTDQIKYTFRDSPRGHRRTDNTKSSFHATACSFQRTESKAPLTPAKIASGLRHFAELDEQEFIEVDSSRGIPGATVVSLTGSQTHKHVLAASQTLSDRLAHVVTLDGIPMPEMQDCGSRKCTISAWRAVPQTVKLSGADSTEHSIARFKNCTNTHLCRRGWASRHCDMNPGPSCCLSKAYFKDLTGSKRGKLWKFLPKARFVPNAAAPEPAGRA